MTALKEKWQKYIYTALTQLADETGTQPGIESPKDIMVGNPPSVEMGDFAFAMFPFAKVFRKAPAEIAKDIVGKLNKMPEAVEDGSFTQAGPYVNVKMEIGSTADAVLERVLSEKENYGKGTWAEEKKIMIEFSCPNTNKPLHLGHLRNDAIGSSVARILGASGAEVKKVNLINDRGIHICKSMLAYKEFGAGSTPESTGIKSDHFVGDYYVKFDKWSKDEPDAINQAQKMLQDWEAGEPETTRLWKQMNKWTIDGIEETYKKTGISFDKVYYESQTYTSGKAQVMKGLDDGVFYKEDDNSVWVDLSEIKLDKKVLLRGDGTTLYMTQDIGTAIARHDDWPFEKLIYVVGSEQQYHFRVLFYIFEKLGYSWAKNLKHLSYGMVNLPEGKMKSREGTVVDADDLVKQLSDMAEEEIKIKEREGEVDNVEETAHSIALGALNYYLLQAAPAKDMIFNPKESLSFNGNTGPYLQYMGARISSMLRKFEDRKTDFTGIEADGTLLKTNVEKEIIKLIISWPETVKSASEDLNPSIITSYIYEMAKKFSKFYHDYPILNNDNKKLAVTRMILSKAVLQILKNGFELIGIPFLKKM